MKHGLVFLSLLFFVAGCGNDSNPVDEGHSTFQTAILGEVIWHGVKYHTPLIKVIHDGGKLGLTLDLVHRSGKVIRDAMEEYFVSRLPGLQFQDEIAVKINARNEKYVKKKKRLRNGWAKLKNNRFSRNKVRE